MTSSNFTESVVEQAASAWFECIGWVVRNGPRSHRAKPAPNDRTTRR
jgi:hypothetical protein